MSMTIAGKPIDVGLWYDFRNPTDRPQDYTRLYAQTLEHIQYAERLGFDTIWTSEHHFIDDGYSPSLLPICAAIAARTQRVRIGTNILLLLFHDPVRIAEDTATVDIISGGRMDLGVAVGYKNEEFAGFNIDKRRRASRMDEAVEVIRRSWAPETFSFEGRHFCYTNINVTPKPVQDPMPLWFGGFSEPAVKRAARLGDGILAAANVIPVYKAERERLGRSTDDRIALGMPWAVVAEDPDRAWAEIAAAVLYQRRRYAEWFSAAGMPIFGSPPASADDLRRRNPDIVVTPARATEIMERAVTELGATHLYWWAIPPGVPPRATTLSMELVSRHLFASI
jgi:probable F420-dependent oxidoreductase